MPPKKAPFMELFRTDGFYIFQNGEHSLWWDRITGECQAKSGWDLVSATNPECLGITYGIVGKVELSTVLESRLMLIRSCAYVGNLPGDHAVYKIQGVSFLQLVGSDAVTQELGLEPCAKHQYKRAEKSGGMFDIQQKTAFVKTWGTIKSATNSIKNTTQQAAALATSQVKSGKKRDIKETDRFERRIIEELHKIVTETDSFYFSPTGDLTNSLQRQWKMQSKLQKYGPIPLWKQVDGRFFWNIHMLEDILQLNSPGADPWVLPVIQGYVQIEHCKVDIGCDRRRESMEPNFETFTLSLVSRRSRFRAGTRYKRRGVDDSGKCANYVETEQIITYHNHQVSFVQVRGSVPIYWSQPGYKYRPPPRLDKGEAETQVAFEKHFHEELGVHGPVCIISLIEQSGKEKIIGDSYANHVRAYNSPDLTYVTFDFHEYCRGMHFENVSVLIGHLVDIIHELGFCWIDKEGLICLQNGVFRVNCIDCLDRTNVVQTALAKSVMEMVFTKLGLIAPEGELPANIRNTFQLLWANNGDTISRQYAGTNALKGDYTRTGERKFTGLMKDGMNSANRYYRGHFVDYYRQAGLDIMQGRMSSEREPSEVDTVLGIAQACIPPNRPPKYLSQIALIPEFELVGAFFNLSRYYLSRFKDMYRQATIDLMLGNPVTEDVFCPEKSADEEDIAITAEHVKQLIEDCKKMLISEREVILGAWGLIDADPVSGDPTETEMDSILILTRDSYYAAEYDDQTDRVTKYQRVLLEEMTLIEFGSEQTLTSIFKSTKPGCCIRLNYRVNGESGYYHMFRSTNLRFFNNMAVVIHNDEEMLESMRAICEAFTVALEIQQIEIPLTMGKIEKRKSKVPLQQLRSGPLSYLDMSSLPQMTRNVSESQLLALKSVGTKAITNMTQQFNKLNKLSIRHNFNPKKNARSLFGAGGDRAELGINKPLFSVGSENGSEEGAAQDQSKHSSGEDIAANFNDILMANSNRLLSTRVLQRPQADMVLPSCGIIASPALGRSTPTVPFIDRVSLSQVVQQRLLPPRAMLTHSRSDLSINETLVSQFQLLPPSSPSLTPSPQRTLTPEITVEAAEQIDDAPDGNVHNQSRHFSHSSGEVDKKLSPSLKTAEAMFKCRESSRSASEHDLTLNITSSQSESALKSLRGGMTSVLTSPSTTKEFVMSPLTRLAKGMQNLGANLDPRKLKQTRQPTAEDTEEYRRLQEKWKNCRTRLIAL